MLQGLVIGPFPYVHSIPATSLNIYTLMISKFLLFAQTIPLNSRLDIQLLTHHLLLDGKYGFGLNLSKAKPLIFLSLTPKLLLTVFSNSVNGNSFLSVPQARNFGVIFVSFFLTLISNLLANPVDSLSAEGGCKGCFGGEIPQNKEGPQSRH